MVKKAELKATSLSTAPRYEETSNKSKEKKKKTPKRPNKIIKKKSPRVSIST